MPRCDVRPSSPDASSPAGVPSSGVPSSGVPSSGVPSSGARPDPGGLDDSGAAGAVRASGHPLRVTKALMLVTDVGFLVYFSITGLGLIPPEWAFADYADPLTVSWNWSFLWIDVLASATGLTSLHLVRRGARNGPALMLVSLVLTAASGLMAIAFWTLRGDFSLAWWIPNLYLLVFPLPAIARLAGPGRGGGGRRG